MNNVRGSTTRSGRALQAPSLCALTMLCLLCASLSAKAAVLFKSPVTNAVLGPDNVTAVDLDLDGKLDLIGSSRGNAFVLYGNGDGTFGAPDYWAVGSSTTEVIAKDVNNDGNLDLLACDGGSNKVAVVLNTGPRTFAAPVLYVTGTRPYGVAAGDLNGDGYADLAVSNNGNNTLSILLNNGDGTFAAAVNYGSGGSPAHCLIEDLTGDGYMDVAISDYVSADVNVFYGNGAGGFSGGKTYIVGSYPAQVLAGDFNNDGKPDLATANTFASNVCVLFNDGTGLFTRSPFYNSGAQPHIMRAGDVDNDGNLDLIIPNAGSSVFNVMRNSGGGVFEAPKFFSTPGTDIRSVGVGDFNGDGKLDVACTDSTANAVYVYINQTGPVVNGLTIAPTRVTGGNPAVGTVTLDGPAPAAGLDVTLASSSASASVPATVTVPGGATQATFDITTSAVSVSTNATITATTLTVSKSALLIIKPPSVMAVLLSPKKVAGGYGVDGTVTLTGPAPAGGVTVTLSSNNGVATPDASTFVPGGASSAPFSITTSAVTSTVSVKITATLFTSSRSATLMVLPLLKSVTVKPSSITGGKAALGTVTLNGPAPAGGSVVSLSSDSAALTAPPSVTVPEGAISVTFPIGTSPVSANTAVTLTASLAGFDAMATATVKPPVLSGIKFSPTKVASGGTVIGTVTLNGPAPAGFTVTLSSSDGSAFPVPPSVTFTAGNLTATFPVTAGSVGASTLVTVTATDPAGVVTKTATVTVTP